MKTNLFLTIKSIFKKYSPKFVYDFFYILFKYVNFYIFNKKENFNLVHFRKPIFKKIYFKDISFYLKINPENGLIDKEIFLNNIWEKDIVKIINKYIKEDFICLDIGANIGHHSLFMSVFANKGKVYVFEPILDLANQIKESINKNNFKNVFIQNFGLSNENKSSKIYLDNLNIGRSTFDKRKEATKVIDAELKVFDEFWQNREKIDFIKIDVEGFEFFVLEGMKNSIQKYRPIILLEFTPDFYKKINIDSKEILNFLFSFNYELYDLENNFSKIENSEEKIDCFIKDLNLQTNILCLPKI